MFVSFFLTLRAAGLKTSITEFFDFIRALELGVADCDLERLYRVARATLVKQIQDLDTFDQVFAYYFKDIGELPTRTQVRDEIMEWLKDPVVAKHFSEEELAAIRDDFESSLSERFEELLNRQDERHDGGNTWIGTGGTSPFGHSGAPRDGIRVGGPGRNRRAVQVAQKRRFANLRTDASLDRRQFQTALKQLRRLSREDGVEELDLEASIDQTAKMGGEIELVFRKTKKNRVKLLLLLDVGGSMDPYAELSSMLFRAAHQATHFKEMKTFYFHNAPYERLYTDMYREEGIATTDLLKELDPSWHIIFVGDGAMAPTELLSIGGAIDYFHYNQRTGLEWLQDFRDKSDRIAWLNPDPVRYWNGSYSCQIIQRLFPMFPFTVDGLHEAVTQLRKGPS